MPRVGYVARERSGDAVLVPPGARYGSGNAGKEPLKLVLIWGEPLCELDGMVDRIRE